MGVHIGADPRKPRRLAPARSFSVLTASALCTYGSRWTICAYGLGQQVGFWTWYRCSVHGRLYMVIMCTCWFVGNFTADSQACCLYLREQPRQLSTRSQFRAPLKFDAARAHNLPTKTAYHSRRPPENLQRWNFHTIDTPGIPGLPSRSSDAQYPHAPAKRLYKSPSDCRLDVLVYQ